MSAEEKFDVIVVGGGPAGLSAGYFLAKKGFEVVVLERGEDIGTKNMFGGRIYSHVFDKYYPGWRDEAPVERWVRRERFTILCKEGSISLQYIPGQDVGEYDSFTAFLSKFLKWMAVVAESEGALVLPGVKVDKILLEDGYASGVLAGGDRLTADYIVVAEGINTLLVEELGLKGRPRPESLGVGVKEVFKLGRDAISRRFGIGDGEGVAEFLIGYPINKYGAGGFVYTMDEYVSIGAVMKIGNVYKSENNVMDLAEDLRSHPYIKSLVEGGTIVEYSAHMVGEGWGSILERPYGDGLLVVGDAAGTLVNTGFTVRGVDYAVESSRLAADVIEESHGAGDRSSAFLSRYKNYLDSSVIGRSLRRFRKVPEVLSLDRLHTTYIDLICDVLSGVYTVGEETPSLKESIDRGRRGRVSIFRMILDLFTLWRSL